MRFGLSPRRQSSLTAQFTEIAQLVLSASGDLALLLAAEASERPQLTAAIADSEHEAFEACRRIERLLRSTLVTPYDRHDLTDLAQQFTRVADRLEEAADLTTRYRIGRLPAPLLQQAQIIERSCDVLAAGITHLRVLRNMQDTLVELHRLANHGEVLNRQAKEELLLSGGDPLRIIAELDVARAVAGATEALRDVAAIIDRIQAKEI